MRSKIIIASVLLSMTGFGGTVVAQTQFYQPGTMGDFSYETDFAGQRTRQFLNSQNRLPDNNPNTLARRGNWDTDLSWDRPIQSRPFPTDQRDLYPNGIR